MNLARLKRKIEQKQARLAVIGLGYVGLPLACEFARVGFDVLGIDIDQPRVVQINAGISPIEGNEPGLAELLHEVIDAGRLKATIEYGELRDRDVVFINVETPVDAENIPQYRALREVLKDLGSVLKEGALVIVESTLAPGTMSDLVLPQLETHSGKAASQDFYLGHCPERVMPGKLLHNIRSVSRVVGGMNHETAEAMVALYRHIVPNADLDTSDCLTAELVKTAENAYRDVNIAFANELALVCQAIGGEFLRVRELINKSPGRNVLMAGAGVGGHCIPKDPWLLVHKARQKVPIQVISAARAVNDGMPAQIADLTLSALREAGISPVGARVVVLGYAYLENSDDTRNSPSALLVPLLQNLGMSVAIHDPWVREYQLDLEALLANASAAILMVAHDLYRSLDWLELAALMQTPVLVDGRHVVEPAAVRRPGFVYRGIGHGD